MRKLFITVLLILLNVALVQAQTVKKILIEEFTGTWCGGCPRGTLEAEAICAANPQIGIPVEWHNNDPLQISDGPLMEGILNVGGFPAAAVDRVKHTANNNYVISSYYWSGSFNARKLAPAIASVSFQNTHFDGVNYTAKVNVKFTALPAAGRPIKVNVYLTEDSIAAVGLLAQKNYDNTIQNGASPLPIWFHNYTVRSLLAGTAGFNTIPATVAVGTTYTENISFIIPPTWNKSQINVIAFAAYYGDSSLNQREILNSEESRLATWTMLGVEDGAAAENMLLNVYPNPANANSRIRISFSLRQDAFIRMEVLDVLGRIVGSYESLEIKGEHTVPLTAAISGRYLTAGEYFVRLSATGQVCQTSRFVIE